MKAPTKADLLDEIRRLSAENERLTRLVQTQRPEIDQLRHLEVGIRDLLNNVPRQLELVQEECQALMQGWDDLPTFMEMRGAWSKSKRRVDHALSGPQGDGDRGER